MDLVMLCIWACAVMALLALIKSVLSAQESKLQHHLPPSPPDRRPILGHLHLLQLPLHCCLQKLSQKYGPIFFLKMGSSPTVVVSSPHWAKVFLHTHDHQFADRPQMEASKRIFYNRTIITMEYGPMWRHFRKLCTVHILSSKRVEMFEAPRLEEMAMTLKLIERHALAGRPQGVDIRKLVFSTVGNMMSSVLFSRRSFDTVEAMKGGEAAFKEAVEKAATLFGSPFLGDSIPWLGWLDVRGLRRQMDVVAQQFDAFFEKLLEERLRARRGAHSVNDDETTDSDYLDILLRIFDEDGTVDQDCIKCILLDMLVGSVETTTITIEWTLAELLKNTSYMKKLQEQLDMVIIEEDHPTKCVKDSQIIKLEYLQAIVKETLRLHPPFPMVLRQMCRDLDKGVQVGDYHLPKETKVLINIWAMARDTTIWGENAATFCPDRFLTYDFQDIRVQDYKFLSFGTGRRGCPGVNMAWITVPFVVANLVRTFNWEIPSGITLDLSEKGSFSAPMAKPLVVIPKLRQRG